MTWGSVSITIALAILTACSCQPVPKVKRSQPTTPQVLLAEADPKLRTERDPAKTGEKGWRLFEKAVRAMPQEARGSENVFPDWSALERGIGTSLIEAERVLAKFKPTFDLLDRALEAPKWIRPLGDVYWRPSSNEVWMSMNLSRALTTRAKLRLEDGQSKSAVDDLVRARDLGDRLLDAELTAADWLVATALQARANRAIQIAAQHDRLSQNDLKRILKRVSPPPDRLRQYAAMLRTDFQGVLLNGIAKDNRLLETLPPDPKQDDSKQKTSRLFQQMLEGHREPFDRAATVREASRLYVEAVRNTDRPWGSQDDLDMEDPSLKAWPEDFSGGYMDELDDSAQVSPGDVHRAKAALAGISNPYGRFLLASDYFLSPALPSQARKQLVDDQASAVIVAARLFSLRHGRFPTALSELVKERLLSAEPVDPFSGRPFLYDAARTRFWSVGPNGKDDGGELRTKMFDIPKDVVYPLDAAFPELQKG
jgi:hypothetical protein